MAFNQRKADTSAMSGSPGRVTMNRKQKTQFHLVQRQLALEPWLDHATGRSLELSSKGFFPELIDASILSEALNKLDPKSPRLRLPRTRVKFQQLDNCTKFLQACQAVGLKAASKLTSANIVERTDEAGFLALIEEMASRYTPSFRLKILTGPGDHTATPEGVRFLMVQTDIKEKQSPVAPGVAVAPDPSLSKTLAPAPAAAPTPSPSPAGGPLNRCVSCKEPLQAKVKFCRKCGAKQAAPPTCQTCQSALNADRCCPVCLAGVEDELTVETLDTLLKSLDPVAAVAAVAAEAAPERSESNTKEQREKEQKDAALLAALSELDLNPAQLTLRMRNTAPFQELLAKMEEQTEDDDLAVQLLALDSLNAAAAPKRYTVRLALLAGQTEALKRMSLPAAIDFDSLSSALADLAEPERSESNLGSESEPQPEEPPAPSSPQEPPQSSPSSPALTPSPSSLPDEPIQISPRATQPQLTLPSPNPSTSSAASPPSPEPATKIDIEKEIEALFSLADLRHSTMVRKFSAVEGAAATPSVSARTSPTQARRASTLAQQTQQQSAPTDATVTSSSVLLPPPQAVRPVKGNIWDAAVAAAEGKKEEAKPTAGPETDTRERLSSDLHQVKDQIIEYLESNRPVPEALRAKRVELESRLAALSTAASPLSSSLSPSSATSRDTPPAASTPASSTVHTQTIPLSTLNTPITPANPPAQRKAAGRLTRSATLRHTGLPDEILDAFEEMYNLGAAPTMSMALAVVAEKRKSRNLEHTKTPRTLLKDLKMRSVEQEIEREAQAQGGKRLGVPAAKQAPQLRSWKKHQGAVRDTVHLLGLKEYVEQRYQAEGRAALIAVYGDGPPQSFKVSESTTVAELCLMYKRAIGSPNAFTIAVRQPGRPHELLKSEERVYSVFTEFMRRGVQFSSQTGFIALPAQAPRESDDEILRGQTARALADVLSAEPDDFNRQIEEWLLGDASLLEELKETQEDFSALLRSDQRSAEQVMRDLLDELAD